LTIRTKLKGETEINATLSMSVTESVAVNSLTTYNTHINAGKLWFPTAVSVKESKIMFDGYVALHTQRIKAKTKSIRFIYCRKSTLRSGVCKIQQRGMPNLRTFITSSPFNVLEVLALHPSLLLLGHLYHPL